MSRFETFAVRTVSINHRNFGRRLSRLSQHSETMWTLDPKFKNWFDFLIPARTEAVVDRHNRRDCRDIFVIPKEEASQVVYVDMVEMASEMMMGGKQLCPSLMFCA